MKTIKTFKNLLTLPLVGALLTGCLNTETNYAGRYNLATGKNCEFKNKQESHVKNYFFELYQNNSDAGPLYMLSFQDSRLLEQAKKVGNPSGEPFSPKGHASFTFSKHKEGGFLSADKTYVTRITIAQDKSNDDILWVNEFNMTAQVMGNQRTLDYLKLFNKRSGKKLCLKKQSEQKPD